MVDSNNTSNYRFHSPNISFKNSENQNSLIQYQSNSESKKHEENFRKRFRNEKYESYEKSESYQKIEKKNSAKKLKRKFAMPTYIKDAKAKLKEVKETLHGKRKHVFEEKSTVQKIEENLENLDFSKKFSKILLKQRKSHISESSSSKWSQNSSSNLSKSPKNVIQNMIGNEKLSHQQISFKKKLRKKPQKPEQQQLNPNVENSKATIAQKLREIYEENEKIEKEKKEKIEKTSFKSNEIISKEPQSYDERTPLKTDKEVKADKTIDQPHYRKKIKIPSRKGRKKQEGHQNFKNLLEQQERKAIMDTPPNPKQLEVHQRTRSRRQDHRSRSRSGSIKKMIKDADKYFEEKRTPYSNNKGGYTENYENVKKKRIDLRNLTPNIDNVDGKRAPKLSKKSTRSTHDLNSTPNTYYKHHQMINAFNVNRRQRRDVGRSNTPAKKGDFKGRSYRSSSKNKIPGRNYKELNLKKTRKIKKSDQNLKKHKILRKFRQDDSEEISVDFRKRTSNSKKKLTSLKYGDHTSSRDMKSIDKITQDLCDVKIEDSEEKRAKSRIRKLSDSESLEKMKEINRKINDGRKKGKHFMKKSRATEELNNVLKKNSELMEHNSQLR